MQKDFSDYVNLLQDIFQKMNIQSRRFRSFFDWKDSSEDQLLQTIWGNEIKFGNEYSDMQSLISDTIAHHSCVLIRNIFHCDYLIMPIPGYSKDSILLIGPFLINEFSRSDILQLCNQLSIPEIHYDFLYQYYNMIPVIKNLNCIKSIVSCFGNKIYGESGFEVEQICYPDMNHRSLKFSSEIPILTEQGTSSNIEKRYRQETELMSSIAAGDYKRARKAFLYFKEFQMEKRIPDSIRNKKNYLIILNTLCRKSAELGNVHPVYLDSLSSKLAVKIEKQNTQKQLEDLENELIHKYCLLVKNFSTKGHSPIISDIINHVSMNLAENLKLSHVAELFSISNSYLSTLFKKECGVPYNTYVTHRRMDYAIALLNVQKCSIQEIAVQCGIPDLTYFTKLFKNRYGMTPTEYRKKLM